MKKWMWIALGVLVVAILVYVFRIELGLVKKPTTAGQRTRKPIAVALPKATEMGYCYNGENGYFGDLPCDAGYVDISTLL